MSILQRIQYLTVLFFLKLSKILPASFLSAIFKFFALILFRALKSRRELTIKNLTLVYPQKSKKEIYALAKACFKSVAITASEIMLIMGGRKHIDDFLINKDEILKSLSGIAKENKNGIVFVTAHFGNWEILPHLMAMNGYSMVAIGREGDNKLIEKNLTKPFREKYGNQNIYKNEAMRKMVKTLRECGNVGLLIDQKAGRVNSVLTTFFGIECRTTISVASLKLKYNPLVIPIFTKREGCGKYRIIFYGTADYKADDKDGEEEKIQALTQYYNDILERAVKEAPEQWFWMHNRWKL
ncbi:MAG: lysophospholipid acyltransferase family protein [Campylobacteraceae bacterium]|jgi:KDO2-lipid IV(A) lauroyltransferase|nr:lysophospholipid acyltransferase family protein [Campylobacteraceae bacterium]